MEEQNRNNQRSLSYAIVNKEKSFNDILLSLLLICERNFNSLFVSRNVDSSVFGKRNHTLNSITKIISYSLFEVFNKNELQPILENVYFVNKNTLFCKTGDFILPILDVDYEDNDNDDGDDEDDKQLMSKNGCRGSVITENNGTGYTTFPSTFYNGLFPNIGMILNKNLLIQDNNITTDDDDVDGGSNSGKDLRDTCHINEPSCYVNRTKPRPNNKERLPSLVIFYDELSLLKSIWFVTFVLNRSCDYRVKYTENDKLEDVEKKRQRLICNEEKKSIRS